MSGVNGTFHSPNYPNKYPDGQYCSWRITVSPAQRIHLMFTDFSLQSENNTAALYVFDAENDTGESLGVFYGEHPPPKNGIKSSSSHMFIIFKSDETDSSFPTGFNATYSAVYKSGKKTRKLLSVLFYDLYLPADKLSKTGNLKCRVGHVFIFIVHMILTYGQLWMYCIELS